MSKNVVDLFSGKFVKVTQKKVWEQVICPYVRELTVVKDVDSDEEEVDFADHKPVGPKGPYG